MHSAPRNSNLRWIHRHRRICPITW